MVEYFCDTLDNGLRVVSVPMPYHHSCEVLFSVGIGSRYESRGKSGISHFLEHMLFKGTAEYPTGLALERAFESLGGSANAATDSETTSFHSRIHPEHLGSGIALFASMLQRPLLSDLELERRVILEEALGDLNESGRQINPDNIVAQLLYPNHPLGQPTVGLRHSIEKLGLAQLKSHHAIYYTPHNTVLAVAGPIDHLQVKTFANESFQNWVGDHAPLPKPWTDLPEQAPRFRWVRDAGSQVSLQCAFLMPGRNSDHAVNLRVLRRLLGWGGMSRLMLRLREELGLTYAVEAMLALYADTGVFAIDLAVSPQNISQALQAILELFSELHQTPVNDADLLHTLASYRYDLDYSRDQVDEMALRYGWSELTGCKRTIEADLAALEQVTAENLQETTRTFFTPDRLRGAVVGPYTTGQRNATETLITAWRP
ncbi:MAG: insulinase family protein [Deltaproteobacteria bacterium]|nr:insulinase family protein [Deltaproteobacteria bacterium]